LGRELLEHFPISVELLGQDNHLNKKLKMNTRIIISYIILSILGICNNNAQTDNSGVSVTFVSTTPRAMIYINDVERGIDSCNVKLSPGVCNVKVTRKGWRDREEIVTIDDAYSQRVVIPEMEQLYGTLLVSCKPNGSIVYINGERKGVTPLSLSLPLTSYGLKVEKDGYQLFNTPAILREDGEVLTVDGELSPSTSKDANNVILTSSLSGLLGNSSNLNSSISINGKIKRITNSSNVKIGKEWFYHFADFTYMNGEKSLEQCLSKILFKVNNTSLVDAYNKHVSGFEETKPAKKMDKENEQYFKYTVDTLCYKPGKYIGLHTTILQQTIEKGKANLKRSERHIIYDILHGKVLSMEDIFIPEVLETTKQKIGNARLHMAMTDEMIVFGMKRKNNLMMLPYNNIANLLTEEFKQLVDIDWDNLSPIKIVKKNDDRIVSDNKGNPSNVRCKFELSVSTKPIIDERNQEGTYSKSSIEDYIPKYPGGYPAFMKFVFDNLSYPKEAVEKELSGKVVANFLVEPYGSYERIRIIESPYPILENEVLRVLRKMPVWQPARQIGLSLLNQCTVTIRFIIEKDKQ